MGRGVSGGQSAEKDAGLCGRCGQPAMGVAYINETRYCHGTYDPGPTCYELAQRERYEPLPLVTRILPPEAGS